MLRRARFALGKPRRPAGNGAAPSTKGMKPPTLSSMFANNAGFVASFGPWVAALANTLGFKNVTAAQWEGMVKGAATSVETASAAAAATATAKVAAAKSSASTAGGGAAPEAPPAGAAAAAAAAPDAAATAAATGTPSAETANAGAAEASAARDEGGNRPSDGASAAGPGEAGVDSAAADNDAAAAAAAARDPAALRAAVAKARAELASMEAAGAELRGRVAEAAADAVNATRIAAEDVANTKRYGMRGFAKEMVEVADGLDRVIEALEKLPPAEAHAHAERAAEDPVGHAVEHLRTGVTATHRALAAALSTHGVERMEVEPRATRFDAERHQALFLQPHKEGGPEPGTVFCVLKQGYTIGDRVLRAADVGVVADREA